MSNKINLIGMTLQELEEFVLSIKMPKFRAKQIADWIYIKNVSAIDEFKNFSLKDRDILNQHCIIKKLAPSKFVESTDGTKKYLFVLDLWKSIEVAYIPESKRNTLCLSSQVGCRMGCQFCMTDKQSLQRSLTTAEIINQILSLPEKNVITNLVFMGMGEPLDNYDAVIKALEIITSPWGFNISPHKVTLSTVGLIPNLKRFLNESSCNLALSVHNPISDERASFMPIERGYKVKDVMEVIKNYEWPNWRKFSVEYILFKDLNDDRKHINALVKLLHGMRVKVNLISYHEIPGESFKGVDDQKMEWFRDQLKLKGLQVTIRKSRGQDIDAACGLLSTKENK
ncbi:MAG: 23S rRNA (adenine(2503)-C(2))-methyltransferase RlmN [Spirochaetales bacterium]|nr:23S rRNA (adenine(2503)-C(2))-methyltransferase RlmN [Spirochaetales bacterium]